MLAEQLLSPDEGEPLEDSGEEAVCVPASSRSGRFGGKGFGLLASIALTTNNISGAGMLEFPQMFQRAGLLPSLLSLCLVTPVHPDAATRRSSGVCVPRAQVCVVATLSATTLADTVARIPRNRDFRRRVEFSDIFEHYIGRRTAMLTQAVVFLNLLSQNLAAIVATAQMFDSFAGAFWPGASVALRLSPAPIALVRWDAASHCHPSKSFKSETYHKPEGASALCVPFASEGQDALLISAGYVACVALFAPLGLLTLEENMLQQNFSFVALLLLVTQFVFAFCSTGLRAGSLPWIGEHWIDTVGVVIFNFAFCVTVPSWLNEKAPGVSVNRVFWISTVLSTLLYTSVGVLGALAFADVPENILSLLVSERVGLTTRLCGILFGVLIIGLGVPIFCVIMRYNLVNGGFCSEPWAHVWSSVLPWGMGWTLYQGSVMLKLLDYSGLVLNGFIDFVAPGVVTLISLGAAQRIACCWRGFPTPSSSANSATYTSAGAMVDPTKGSSSATTHGDSLQPVGHRVACTFIKPFPAALRPFYVEIVGGMVAFLLVVLPIAVWLQAND